MLWITNTFCTTPLFWRPAATLADPGNEGFADLLQQWVHDLDNCEGNSSNEPIHSDKLAIGPSAPVGGNVASSSQPGPVLHVEGDATMSGIIRAQQVVPLSDERAKCTIRAPDHDALSIIQTIKIYRYTFNSSLEGRQLQGPLAQQLAKVLPDAVETDPNGNKHVDFTS